MKKAKENWIGEQRNEIEKNLRKNNSKRAHQLVKNLTAVKQGKVTTVQSLKKGKSAGVDNIPAELVQEGTEDIITALTTICNKICSSARTTDKEQRHAEDNTEQIEATSGEDHR